MQTLPTEKPMVPFALDLNNIPYIELKNIDGTQQRVLKDDIADIKNDARVWETLENNQKSVHNTSANVPVNTSHEQGTEDALEDPQPPVNPPSPAPVAEVNLRNDHQQATTTSKRERQSNNVIGAS